MYLKSDAIGERKCSKHINENMAKMYIKSVESYACVLVF
jgi:hypothetical protein